MRQLAKKEDINYETYHGSRTPSESQSNEADEKVYENDESTHYTPYYTSSAPPAYDPLETTSARLRDYEQIEMVGGDYILHI